MGSNNLYTFENWGEGGWNKLFWNKDVGTNNYAKIKTYVVAILEKINSILNHLNNTNHQLFNKISKRTIENQLLQKGNRRLFLLCYVTVWYQLRWLIKSNGSVNDIKIHTQNFLHEPVYKFSYLFINKLCHYIAQN